MVLGKIFCFGDLSNGSFVLLARHQITNFIIFLKCIFRQYYWAFRVHLKYQDGIRSICQTIESNENDELAKFRVSYVQTLDVHYGRGRSFVLITVNVGKQSILLMINNCKLQTSNFWNLKLLENHEIVDFFPLDDFQATWE